MKVIAYRHKKGLKWPVCREPLFTDALDVAEPESTTVITFARVQESTFSVCALDRFYGPLAGDVVCSCWDYSPMAGLLLWDVAHALTVGRRLYLHTSDSTADILSREYYSSSFYEEQTTSMGLRVLLKKESLPIERERGLDEWSFCIPTGGNCAKTLNACVSRILSLNIPQLEIILCGKPPDDFAYEDKVRVIGTELVDSPVQITRKKNLLAQSARFKNLCIMHDRVLLPDNFVEAIEQFGDDFPFVGFQSFWFADTWRAIPRRYSDFASAKFIPQALRGSERPGRQHLAEFERMRFGAQHPERSDFGQDYLTGSLCLCKRSLWCYFPQNEALYWAEYEDVEHGIRAAMKGIPSRVNPFSFTESMSYRSIFHHFGSIWGANRRGDMSYERAPMECWGFPRRPALSLSILEGKVRLANFARRYTGDESQIQEMMGKSLSGLHRFKLISKILWRAHGDTKTLVRDWYRDVLCEPEVVIESESLQGMLDSSRSVGEKKIFLLTHISLLRQLYNNFFSSPFCADNNSQNVASWKIMIGAGVSAIWLRLFSQQTALSFSFRQLWKAIRHGGVK